MVTAAYTDAMKRKSKLKTLRAQFSIPTVHKPPEDDIAQQLIMAKVSKDIGGHQGIGTIQTNLQIADQVIPR